MAKNQSVTTSAPPLLNVAEVVKIWTVFLSQWGCPSGARPSDSRSWCATDTSRSAVSCGLPLADAQAEEVRILEAGLGLNGRGIRHIDRVDLATAAVERRRRFVAVHPLR